jgi:hypothetical protein
VPLPGDTAESGLTLESLLALAASQPPVDADQTEGRYRQDGLFFEG